jgi:hypothetical protein
VRTIYYQAVSNVAWGLTEESRMNREQQLRHGQRFDYLAGMPVYSSDNQQLGTVDEVMNSSGQARERYMVVNPAGNRPGTDQLFVPESEIYAIATDRVILERPSGAVPDRRWSAPPDTGRGANV